MRFDLVNPRAVEWVQAHGAELVTEVGNSTRSGIRTLIEAGFKEGMPPRTIARELREVIGLHSRQVAAVSNFKLRLAAQGVDGDALDRRVAKYAQAQLRLRATTIARTEVLRASNEGQQGLWETAASEGLLNKADTRRVWITTNDDRLDVELCEPMDGEEVGLDEPWTLPDGRRVMVPTESHPQCRCTAGLVFS